MTTESGAGSRSGTKGRLIHWARGYDLLAWLFMRGREGAFRERVLDLARIKTGETVIDVGCGTGTLAIAAKRRVGPTGTVYGIDASSEMIARADWKAKRVSVDVGFKEAIVESLPFADERFDAVLSTLMLHHLPRKARAESAQEMRRVLKPGGRVLAVDFGGPQKRGGLVAHLHRHGHVALTDLIDLLSTAGLTVVESGPVGVRNLQFVLATNGNES